MTPAEEMTVEEIIESLYVDECNELLDDIDEIMQLPEMEPFLTYLAVCFLVSLFPCFLVSLFLCFFVSLFLCFFVSLFPSSIIHSCLGRARCDYGAFGWK